MQKQPRRARTQAGGPAVCYPCVPVGHFSDHDSRSLSRVQQGTVLLWAACSSETQKAVGLPPCARHCWGPFRPCWLKGSQATPTPCQQQAGLY